MPAGLATGAAAHVGRSEGFDIGRRSRHNFPRNIGLRFLPLSGSARVRVCGVPRSASRAAAVKPRASVPARSSGYPAVCTPSPHTVSAPRWVSVPHTHAYGREGVQDRHFLPLPRRKWETKKNAGLSVVSLVRVVSLVPRREGVRACALPGAFGRCAPLPPASSLGALERARGLRVPGRMGAVVRCVRSGTSTEDKVPVSHAILKNTIVEALSKIGYECPFRILKKLVAKATPSSSRNSSDAESRLSSRASSRSSSLATSGTNSGKRSASSRSDEETSSGSGSGSDSTVVGSGSGSYPDSVDASFSLVKGKKSNKKARLARHQRSDGSEMETEQCPTAPTVTAGPSPQSNSPKDAIQESVDTNMVSSDKDRKINSGLKPNTPPKIKPPPPIYLLKGVNFIKISADCTRLHINYTKAVLVADDYIKIFSPDVETFRRLNKYFIDNKVQYHTYALEEERGSSTGLVLVVLPKTEEARLISAKLSKVCGLSGIRVEAPHKRGGPGQCHRCQRYGHASANCHVQPRCVKCLVPHWTSECPLTKESGKKPACVNCNQSHTANYRGCPKAPKISVKRTNRRDQKQTSRVPPPLIRDTTHFPALEGRKTVTTSGDGFVPAPAPPVNPWERNQPPRADSAPPREAIRRGPPDPTPARPLSQITSGFADDIKTVMSVLRAVKSSEISEFARDIRACRSSEEKFLVLVNYHHLMIRLENI
ncbi:Nucleic-acid-binding protein from transposon X-element [Eumeta japonica]|uniref:Nucleic-acid-binding protein from transposon X-element n=1 Tax=Eumeta variegata TaxID=151549 RepID=A0A4C1UU23_EUMVA|nr:Nucleic-acid-binding protein from transposon X-element [Eumeta japonica]